MNQTDMGKMVSQINELKDINSTLMKKLEEMQTRKKQQTKEGSEKMAQALKQIAEYE